MDKKELLGIYRTKLNHITLCYGSMVLWAFPDTPDFFNELHGQTVKKYGLFPDIEGLLSDKQAFRIATEEMYASAHRSAVKELFALTKKYCFDTDQLELIRVQPWFPFWRVIRNCWSHDMRFNFNKSERKLLPIRWLNVTIYPEMDGRPLTHGDFSYEHIRLLLETAAAYVNENLA